MSNPYQLTPGRLPAAPHPTPTSVAGYTLPNPKIGRAPIANPYDKFTQPEFDAWIGGITGALKRALGHDEGPPQAKENLSEGSRIPQFKPIDLPEDSDNDGIDDSFAEIKARRAAGKGKARDPREGPGFGKSSVAQPIEIPSSDEEEEEEVEYSVLHQNDSDAEEEPEDSEREIEEDEEYPWSKAERSPNIRSYPPNMERDEIEVQNDEYDEDEEAEHEVYEEEAEYEEYDEDAESEGEQQEQGRPEDEVIELLSDDEEPPVPTNQSRPAVVEEERYDGEEYYSEEDEEYEVEDVEGDDGREGAHPLRGDEYVIEDDEGEIGEFQTVEDDNSFASQTFETLATTPIHRVMSADIPDVRSDPEVPAQDHNSGVQLQILPGQEELSYLEAQSEVNNDFTTQIPIESAQIEEEFRYLDREAETTLATRHEFPQHPNHPQFVDQVENGGHPGPLSVPLHHIRTGSSPVRELSIDRELVEPEEERYIQPPDEDTSFPIQTGESDAHLPQIPDPWNGPREYAQDFYAGGDIHLTNGAHIDADHLGPEDEDHIEESQARKEREAEDNEIQPQDSDTAFLRDDVRSGPVEIPDLWEGAETYAQDYYSDGVNGALPMDRIDPALLPVTSEHPSFLRPYTPTPSQPVDTIVEDKQEHEGEDGDRFALPPAPEGIYVPPSLRARDAPIPVDAEIFNVDDSDKEEAGNPVPISEYPQDTENRGYDLDDELEYVDESMDVVEDIVTAPGAVSQDMHDQSEPGLEQGGGREELAIAEQSQGHLETFSSPVDWNNPPAFPHGVPTSASGHLATPSPEGDDLVAAQGPALADDNTQEIDEVVLEDGFILVEKGESGPPLSDDTETSFRQSIPDQVTVTESEATDLAAVDLEEALVVFADVVEPLSEKIDVVQEPEEPHTQSDAIDVDVAVGVGVDGLPSMAIQVVSEDMQEVNQSMTATENANEPRSPIGDQDDESKLAQLDPIVEEVESVPGSRAVTVPLLDLSVEEIDHNSLVSQEKDTHLLVGIVEHKDATTSPRVTPDREILTVDIIEEHSENTFASQHSGLGPPISTIHHSVHDDYLSGDYSSDGEVDQLDEEEPENSNEDVFSSVVEASVKEPDINHDPADGKASSLVPGGTISPTDVEMGSDAPFEPTTGEEVPEGDLAAVELSLDIDDTAAFGDAGIPSSLNLAGEQDDVVVDTPSGNGPTAHYAVGPDLASPVTGNLETKISAIEIPQDISQQTMSEAQNLVVDFASIISPNAAAADDVEPGGGLDSRADESAAGSKTPIQKLLPQSITTPESMSTNRYSGLVFKTPERYTPSPPKTSPPNADSEAPQKPPASDAAAQNKTSDTTDAGDAMRIQEVSKGSVEAVSPGPKPQTQTINTTSESSSYSHQSTSTQHALIGTPSSGPSTFVHNPLSHLRDQYAANSINPSAPTMDDTRSALPRLYRELTNPQSSFSQTPLLHAPLTSDRFHQQMPSPVFATWPYAPPLFGTWPYSFSAPGAQQQQSSTPVNAPVISPPKSRKKSRSVAASPKSPKKGKKAAQHKDPEVLTHITPEVKPLTTQADSLASKGAAQSSEGDRRPADLQGTSKGLYGQQDPVKGNNLPHIIALESSSIISKTEGVSKQEQQKPKRTYNKRKRAASPGPGEPQVGKADEKERKRPTKRKSKLLELEGPIPGPTNGETIHVKARPKGALPLEPSQSHPSTSSKETIPKSKKGLLSVQSASLPGSIASQTPRPEILLITRAGQPGISHRHGADHSLTIPPAAPSFKALPPRTTSPKKAPVPQSLTQTPPGAVTQPGASSMPESADLASLANTPAIADIVPPTSSTQPLESKSTGRLDIGTTPRLSELSPGSVQTLLVPTTRTLAQLTEVTTAFSDAQTQPNISPVSPKSVLPSNNPMVTAATPPAPGVPSASVVGSTTPSVSNTPASRARITMRETRSTCRYHRISLPKEEGGPRVRFLVPGCALTNDILMKEQEIEDHGLAPVEDAYVMIKDIESLDLNSDLISVLRVLVGHDIFRDQELFYLPSLGEQLPVKPAFRKPTPSDRLESGHHNAGSPSYSSLAGSPTFHKSSASVSESTSSLSALRKAQTSDWGSNLAPTDSEGDSEDDDAHSKASHPGSDHKGKGKSRIKSGRKSKLSRDPDFVPSKEEDKLSDPDRGPTRKRRRATGAKRGVKRIRTEAPGGEDSSRENKKLKIHPTAPSSLASPEKPEPSSTPPNDS